MEAYLKKMGQQQTIKQMPPKELASLKDFKLIEWDNPQGKKIQLVKDTYNPAEKKPMRQAISINDKGDAILITFLLKDYFEI